MQSRRSLRMVRKPKTYVVDDMDDPDYLTEEDEDEEDYERPAQKVRATKRRLSLDDGVDVVYEEKREKNNVAVRKSRMKLKSKHDEAIDKIDRMADERLAMEQDVDQLSAEISELKELLYRITSSSQSCELVGPADLSKLRYFDCMK